MKNLRIGELLKEYGYITEAQLEAALEHQKENKDQRLGAILMSMGYVTENQMLTALGQKLDLSIIDLFTYKIEGEAVAKIPKQTAQKYLAIPVHTEPGRLLVAMNDPLDFYAIEDMRLISGLTIDVVLSEKAGILAAIEFQYAEIGARQAAENINLNADILLAESELSRAEESAIDEDSPVVKLLNSLLVKGYNSSASDIHIEPFERHTLVRMRIDGMIVEYVKLSSTIHPSLIARTKIMGGLDIAEKRAPQDGHFRAEIEGIEMNIRVSVIPTVHGEKAVLRFLSTNTVIDHMGSFGMTQADYQRVIRILQNPHGVVYITGPTGSGKTTTLYMILEYLAKKSINIVTIEDPVEQNLAMVNQMQVNNLAGLTFESGLRAILRQDPDVIMVGETRDRETASISVRSAITGHLVLSTLHTNDAVSAIVRLIDMGVEPYLLANSVVGIVAQRLVKKICPHCKRGYEPTPEERLVVGGQVQTLYKGEGCHLCNNTGYRGRIAVHEIVEVDRKIRRMVSEEHPVDEIYDYLEKNQENRTLRSEMVQLVQEGITSMEELLKVTYCLE